MYWYHSFSDNFSRIMEMHTKIAIDCISNLFSDKTIKILTTVSTSALAGCVGQWV